jgi:serine/threonine protein kinase
MNDTMNNNNTLWILLDFIPGCSLIDFIKNYQREISLLEAVNFCIKLLNIINSFHASGIVHRDIKPGNIHIECQNRTSLDKGQITVLDFGQAYIQKGKNIGDTVGFDPERCTTADAERMGNYFYRVSQLDPKQAESMSQKEETKTKQLRRSPTIDASSVCAILFWLMIDPKSKCCPAYHGFLDANSNIVNQIKQAVNDAGV